MMQCKTKSENLAHILGYQFWAVTHSHRALIEMVRALDLRARQWYLYTVAARESHRNTLSALEPYVQAGIVSPDLLSPMMMELSGYMSSPSVGGTVAPCGPAREAGGDVHRPPYASQPASARRFRTRSVRLPESALYF